MWIAIFVVMTVVAAAATTWPLWAKGDLRAAAPRRAAHEVAAEKQALAEVERDLARGALTPKEAEGAKREIARRLLAAAQRLEDETPIPPAPGAWARRAATATVAATVVGALIVYIGVGSPGRADEPLGARDLLEEARAGQPTQADAEAAYRASPAFVAPPALSDDTAELFEQMRGAIAARPNDPRGRELLADALQRSGRPDAAWPLYLDAADRTTAPTRDAAEAATRLRAAAGQAMVAAAGGVVSREAEDVFAALGAEPIAAYFVGLAHTQRGLLDEAYEIWVDVLRANPDAPFTQALAQQTLIVADEIGVPLSERPPALIAARIGVDPDTAAGVAALSPEDRLAFMESRADALAAELAEEPDDLDGWAMLIRTYGRLGRDADALAALAAAEEAFDGDAEALLRLRGEAQDVGLQTSPLP